LTGTGLHGTRERHRRRATAAIGTLSVLAVAGAAVATGAGAGHPAARRPAGILGITPPRIAKGETRVAPSTPLVRLAAYVRLMPSEPQPGDATLVVRDTVIDGVHETDGAVYGGYDLYTDSGQYYYAPDSLAQLQQQVDTHQTVIGSGDEAETLDTIAAAAGGTPAQARAAVLSTEPRDGMPPTPAEERAFLRQLPERLRRRFEAAARHPDLRLYEDSDIWGDATQALAVGAGRSDVRTAAIKALSTLAGVIQTPTVVRGIRALKVEFPDDGQPETIWLNADSGVPIQEQDGSNSATAFEVERVTAAKLPSQMSPNARLR
jgi:hypothetical protein